MYCALGWYLSFPSLVHASFALLFAPSEKDDFGAFPPFSHCPSLFHTRHFSPHSLLHTSSSSSTTNHGSPSRRLSLGHQPLFPPHRRCPSRLLIHPLPRLLPRQYVQKHTRTHAHSYIPLRHLLFVFTLPKETRKYKLPGFRSIQEIQNRPDTTHSDSLRDSNQQQK